MHTSRIAEAPVDMKMRSWVYTKLLEIELFVKEVISVKPIWLPPEIDNRHLRSLNASLVDSYCFRIEGMFAHGMHTLFDYKNPYVRLFLTACRNLTKQEVFMQWVMTAGISIREAAYQLISQIQQLAKGNFFRSKLFAHDNWADVSYAKAKDYVDTLFDRCSRYAVVRLDLSYKSDKKHLIDIEQAKLHLDSFLHAKGRERPKIFAKLAGYVWRMDFGIDAGFHFHLLLFFKNAYGVRGAYYGNEFGIYWRDFITKGIGRFENCNAREYRYNGIGEVNRSDIDKREILQSKVLRYLFKGTQRIPVRQGQRKFRSWGTGEL
ncbi:inovirus-type Gp2 protein [Dechloromonas sp. ZS-1]|uniref:YagK/YfjJ domain-containing protein n=1 Tax=Dechloromonas sp. ZS-1 TaxID=3138067 RepID=UPI0031FBE88D